MCPLYHLRVQSSKGEGDLIIGTDGLVFDKKLEGVRSWGCHEGLVVVNTKDD